MEKTVESMKRGRIENLKPWKPGQSGNPGGRPKHDVASDIACAVFEGNEEAVYRAMRKALLKGDPKVFAVLADRAYGKLKEPVDLSVTDGLAERLAAIRRRRLEATRVSEDGLLIEQLEAKRLVSAPLRD
jgi:hypothetical protein